MVRKMAVIGLSYLAGLFIAPFFVSELDLLIGLLLFVLGIILAFFLKNSKNIAVGIGICSAAIALFAYGAYDKCVYEKVCSLNMTNQYANVRVVDKSTDSKSTETYLMQGKIKGHNIKFYVKSFPDELDYEDIVTAEFKFTVPDNTQYFPYKDYYKSKGIFLNASIENITSVQNNKNLLYYLKSYSDYVSEKISFSEPNDEGAMINAMFTGDRTYMSSELQNALFNTGIGHIVSISGFHLSVIAGFAMMLLKKAKRGISIPAIIVLCISYCVFSGFSISTLRATIMLAIFYTAQLVSRRSDSLNSIGTAAFLLTVASPVSGHDASLLLSLLGTLGIAVVGPSLNRRIDEKLKHKSRLRNINSALISAFCAGICTAPVAILYFNGISLVSAFTMLIATPFCTVAVVATLLFAVFGCVPTFLIKGSAWFLKILLDFVKFVSGLDLFYLMINGSHIYIWLVLVSAGTVLFYLIFKSYKKLAAFFMTSFLLMLIINTSFHFADFDKYYVTLLSDGYKGVTVIEKSGSADVISMSHSTFSVRTIIDYLEQANIDRISTLVCYEMDPSDLSVFNSLEKYDIGTVVVPQNIIEDIEKYNIFKESKIISLNSMKIVRENYYNIDIGNYEATINSENFKMLLAYSKNSPDYVNIRYSVAAYSGNSKTPVDGRNTGIISLFNSSQKTENCEFIDIYHTPGFSFQIDKNGTVRKRSNSYAIYN